MTDDAIRSEISAMRSEFQTIAARLDERMHGYTAQIAAIEKFNEMKFQAYEQNQQTQWKKYDRLSDKVDTISVVLPQSRAQEKRLDTLSGRLWGAIILALGSMAGALWSVVHTSGPKG